MYKSCNYCFWVHIFLFSTPALRDITLCSSFIKVHTSHLVVHLHSSHFTVCTLHFALCTLQFTLRSSYFTLYSLPGLWNHANSTCYFHSKIVNSHDFVPKWRPPLKQIWLLLRGYWSIYDICMTFNNNSSWSMLTL